MGEKKEASREKAGRVLEKDGLVDKIKSKAKTGLRAIVAGAVLSAAVVGVNNCAHYNSTYASIVRYARDMDCGELETFRERFYSNYTSASPADLLLGRYAAKKAVDHFMEEYCRDGADLQEGAR